MLSLYANEHYESFPLKKSNQHQTSTVNKGVAMQHMAETHLKVETTPMSLNSCLK